MNKTNFAFSRINYIMIAVCMCMVILGFILMSGGESTTEAYDPSIFSTMRTKIAPAISFIGFVAMIFAIIYKPREKK